ncbi:MAG: hypothetical protein OJF49_003260 [Ktedonobacterales bacterium]|jgi:RNA polymerase sigma-70 factor (ECF subfamily)|nr:MAG: hypothetical protein OJF49_003260 [Ktedonobacterales bacterium]
MSDDHLEPDKLLPEAEQPEYCPADGVPEKAHDNSYLRPSDDQAISIETCLSWARGPTRHLKERAMRVIHARYSGKLYVFAFNRLNSVEDAQDTAQETLIRAWYALQLEECRATTQPEFSTFLFRICANLASDRHRTQHREDKYVNRKSVEHYSDLLQRVDPYLPEEVARSFRIPDPADASVEKDVQRHNLARAMATLSPQQRTCFWMFSQGFSNEKIAESLEITVGTVRGHICRARQRLRLVLQNLGGDSDL